MIHVYYGDGKGKTTAAVGLAARAAGSNMKVLFVQFLKTEFSGERHTLSHTENVTLTFCPLELKFTFEMVVLDEIFDVINNDMISEAEVFEFVTNAPTSMEIVMTGHNPPERFIEIADYVTEFNKIKHPYDRGITGRIGIEF